MKRLTTATALLLSFTLGSAASVPANADTGTIPSVTVKFADLDISRPEGAAQLYGRIKTAAYSVCSSFEGRDLAAQANFKACINDALARAVATVDSPALYAVYRAKTGAPIPLHVATLAK